MSLWRGYYFDETFSSQWVPIATGLRVARGAGLAVGGAFQGWSAVRDRERAALSGPLPVGWTPLREPLGEPVP